MQLVHIIKQVEIHIFLLIGKSMIGSYAKVLQDSVLPDNILFTSSHENTIKDAPPCQVQHLSS